MRVNDVLRALRAEPRDDIDIEPDDIERDEPDPDACPDCERGTCPYDSEDYIGERDEPI